MPQDWTSRVRPAGRGEPAGGHRLRGPRARCVRRLERGRRAPAPRRLRTPPAPRRRRAAGRHGGALRPARRPSRAAVPAAPLVQLRASAEAWVEVRESGGRVLAQRLLRAGESVEVEGTPPLKVKVGNASTVRLAFRGEPVDLAPSTRDNVARLELK